MVPSFGAGEALPILAVVFPSGAAPVRVLAQGDLFEQLVHVRVPFEDWNHVLAGLDASTDQTQSDLTLGRCNQVIAL